MGLTSTAADPWGRNEFGVPPQGCADHGFRQHTLQSRKTPTGRGAILWAHGVFFRLEESEMRHKMIKADHIESGQAAAGCARKLAGKLAQSP